MFALLCWVSHVCTAQLYSLKTAEEKPAWVGAATSLAITSLAFFSSRGCCPLQLEDGRHQKKGRGNFLRSGFGRPIFAKENNNNNTTLYKELIPGLFVCFLFFVRHP
jgi:hypothetical protein